MADFDRREAILLAAATEFATGGYAGGRVERLARLAGVNKQLIFHYFRSKDQLYSTVVHIALSRCQATLPAAATPPESLKAGIDSLSGMIEANPLIPSALADCTFGKSTPEQARASIAEWLQSLRGAFVAVLNDGQQRGFFRDDLWPEAVSDVIVGASVGMALTGRLRKSGSGPAHPRLSDFHTSIGQFLVDSCAWH